MKFTQSNQWRQKAKSLIPAGAHTYSKGDDQFPELSPGFIARGKDVIVWDIDNNEFVDWGMGLRSVILGHAHEPVLDAVRSQLILGSNFTRPSILEAQLAEQLVRLIPCAEMVKFAKNGSDVTTAAVKLARAYTNRDIVLRCVDQPFFSVNDWFIGNTVCDAGIPEAVKALTKNFRYNDADNLEKMLDEHAGKVACVILEAAAAQTPAPNFLQRVRQLTQKHNVVLIFDEIITGFRFHTQGAQFYYDVTPDLASFGKAMANGFSLAALVGRKELMELGGLEHNKPRVFLLSTTNGAETHSLAASLKTLEILEEENISQHLWTIGEALTQSFNTLCKTFGVENHIKMQGPACSPYQVFLNKDGQVDLSLRTLYLQETIKHGLLAPYLAISGAHQQKHINHFIEASRLAMPQMIQAIEQGHVKNLLQGKPVMPVFRKFNQPHNVE